MPIDFKKDLGKLLEAIFTFPKDSNRDSPEPLRQNMKDETKFALLNPFDVTANKHIVGNEESHFNGLRDLIHAELADRFHDEIAVMEGGNDLDGLPIYVRRSRYEKDLKKALGQSQHVRLTGVAGSGKTTLIGCIVHESRDQNFLYLNCAVHSSEIYRGTSLQHYIYTDKRVTPDELTILRTNIATLLLKLLSKRLRRKVDEQVRFDPVDLERAIAALDDKDKYVLVFDDIDVFPTMVQAAVMLLAIDLRRNINIPVLVASRQSNSQRLIREGAFADIYEEVKMLPIPDLDEDDGEELTTGEHLDIYKRRLRVLAKSKAAHEYMLKHHAQNYKTFFGNSLEKLMYVPFEHIQFLIEECQLFSCCNRSIRGANLVLGNLIMRALIGTVRGIDPKDFMTSHGSGRIATRLRDMLYEELFDPTTGTAAVPRIFENLDGIDIACLKLRAIEIPLMSGGLEFGHWHTILCGLYKDLKPETVRETLLTLTERPIFGDPFCVRTAGEIEGAFVYTLPGGQHYAQRLASSVDYLCRSHGHRTKRQIEEASAVERVRYATDCIRHLVDTFLAEDVKRLRHASKSDPFMHKSIEDHYVSRAVHGLSAYVEGNPSMSVSDRSVYRQRVADLRDEIDTHLVS
jgi:hypothetical protein